MAELMLLRMLYLPAAAICMQGYWEGGESCQKPDLDVCPDKIGFSIARMRNNYQVEAQIILMLPEIPSIYVLVRCRENRLKRHLQTKNSSWTVNTGIHSSTCTCSVEYGLTSSSSASFVRNSFLSPLLGTLFFFFLAMTSYPLLYTAIIIGLSASGNSSYPTC